MDDQFQKRQTAIFQAILTSIGEKWRLIYSVRFFQRQAAKYHHQWQDSSFAFKGDACAKRADIDRDGHFSQN